MDEGDEDESLFDDWNDENIPDLLGTAYVHASRVPIMSAHDERAPIDENVLLESRHLRGRPHVHGLMWSVAGQLPPWSPVAAPNLLSGDGVDCAGVEEDAWGVEEDAWGRILPLHEEQRGLPNLGFPHLPFRSGSGRAPKWIEEVD